MASGGDAVSEDYVMVEVDKGGKISTNTNHSNSGNQNASNVQNEGKEIEEIEVSECQDENLLQQTHGSADQKENTKMETESSESGAKDERINVNGGNPESGETQENPSRDRHESLGIFITDRNTDVSWLTDYITENCTVQNMNVASLSADSWTRVADKTSPHIICHSVRSPTTLSELERHLDYFTKSPAPLYFLITEVSDPESELKITSWMSEKMPRTYEILTLYEEEIDSIKPDRYKPRTDTTTRDKLKGMRDLLSRGLRSRLQGGNKTHKVGIFSRSAEEDYSWLQTLLGSDGFHQCVRDVRPCYISSSGYLQFYQDVSRCSFGIVYHTKNRGRVNVTDVTSSLYDEELKHLSERLGRDNVLVVIDDLDDCGPEMKTLILQNQPSIGKLAGDLILFDKEEKSDWEKYLPATRSVNQKELQEKLGNMKGWIKPADVKVFEDEKRKESQDPPDTSSYWSRIGNGFQAKYREWTDYSNNQKGPDTRPPAEREKPPPPPRAESGSSKTGAGPDARPPAEREKPTHRAESRTALSKMKKMFNKHTVVIFSRSSEEDYSWLQTLLRSQRFSHCVQDVRSCYISSSGYQQFTQNVSRCSFGILYHSKNRGRVNVTDVTDSLYDEELEYLSDSLGRKNVLVVIDDLDDCGPEMKHRILQNQPSIERLAGNLLLFDKKNPENPKSIESLIKAAENGLFLRSVRTHR